MDDVAVTRALLTPRDRRVHRPGWGATGGRASEWMGAAIAFVAGAARQLAPATGERERGAEVQQLLEAERLRLSQEVHDVVGHGLAAIQMQADIALHVEDQGAGHARETLLAISTASAQALDELRESLRTIHPSRAGAHPTNFTPSLARVEDLCQRLTGSTANIVDLRVVGDPRPLPTAVDLAAYRLLQESLTNVVKHSPHPAAEVVIEHCDDQVTVQVTNQDLAAAPFTPGIGITGMRRRVAALGGTFTAGPGPEPDTFQVRAALPRRREKVSRPDPRDRES